MSQGQKVDTGHKYERKWKQLQSYVYQFPIKQPSEDIEKDTEC